MSNKLKEDFGCRCQVTQANKSNSITSSTGFRFSL